MLDERCPMEIVSKIALITINETLIIQVISFLIFVFILNRVMVRPLNSVMDGRDTYIESLKEDALKAEQEMDRLTEDLRNRESEARKEALSLKEELENSGSEEASELFVIARKEINELRKDTEKLVEAQITEARKYIEEESKVLATSIMEKVLERRLNQ